MKKFFFVFLLLVTSTAMPIFLSMAESSPAPTVDTPPSPVNANTITVTGTSDPSAKIFITGGPSNAAPVTADDTGHFEISVGLVQESNNIFLVQAQNQGAELSEAVQIEVEEGDEVTATYEAAHGVDHTGPETPEIEETNIETDQVKYTLTGTGESGTTVLSNKEDTGVTVDENGDFSISLQLSGEDTKDSFSIQLEDAAGNQSSAVKVYITSSANPSNQEAPFADIKGHWAEDAINTLYSNGVVNGYENGLFGPNDVVTRAQVMKIALNAFDIDLSTESGRAFSDVANSDWFNAYVSTGAAIGIVKGYDDNSFKPNNPVTRGEALKIILETAGFTDLSGTGENFLDVDSVRDWFAKYTAFAKKADLISGYTDGTFKGNQSITRAEVCVLTQKVVDYLAGQE